MMGENDVIHNKYGLGKIISIIDKKVIVNFNGIEKIFSIHKFNDFFKHNNTIINKYIHYERMKVVANQIKSKKLEDEKVFISEEEYWAEKSGRPATNCWSCSHFLNYKNDVCKTCGGYICPKCGNCLCGFIWY